MLLYYVNCHGAPFGPFGMDDRARPPDPSYVGTGVAIDHEKIGCGCTKQAGQLLFPMALVAKSTAAASSEIA